VRRVRVIGYPPQLLALLPEGATGAAFLPTVGGSCLAAALAGGDYDVSVVGALQCCGVAVLWFRAVMIWPVIPAMLFD
jgi:hypothetical protein